MDAKDLSYENALELGMDSDIAKKAMSMTGMSCFRIANTYYDQFEDSEIEQKREDVKHAVYNMLVEIKDKSDTYHEQLAFIADSVIHILCNLVYGIETLAMLHELKEIEEGNGNDYND